MYLSVNVLALQLKSLVGIPVYKEYFPFLIVLCFVKG